MDSLIRNVVRQRRRLTPSELTQVQQHVATRPFNPRMVPAGLNLAGFQDSTGRTIAGDSRLLSLEQHWLQHVVFEQQWGVGVSQDDYLNDLHQAAAHSTARVFTYSYRGESYAAFLAPDDFTRQGVISCPQLFVAYSATWGVIRTGYKTRGMAAVFRNLRPSALVEHLR